MMRNRMAAIALLAMVVIILPTFSAVNSQPPRTEKARAENFIELTARIEVDVERILQAAARRGVATAEADALVSMGESLLNEARTALASGDNTTALAKAREAQEKFRDAVRLLGRVTPQREQLQERAGGIRVALERITERVQRVKELAAQLTSGPQAQIQELNARIAAAERAISESKSALEGSQPNADAAAKKLAEAEANVGRAFAILQRIARDGENRRFSEFFEKLASLLQNLRDQVSRAESAGKSVSDLKSKLSTASILLESAKTKLASGDKQASVEQLKQIRVTILEIRQGLAAITT